MNKQAFLEEAYNSAFKDELEKIAKITIDDIEDEVGSYLNDNLEEPVRDLIAKETAERFAVRHPLLTGLPTLGLWPAISKGKAVDSIIRVMSRRNPEFRGIVSAANDKARAMEIEDARIQIESDRANQFSNAVSASIAPILASKLRYEEKT